MRIADYERAKVASEAGLAIDSKGGVYCPHCKQGLRFNSANPAVFHETDCVGIQGKNLSGGIVQYFDLTTLRQRPMPFKL